MFNHIHCFFFNCPITGKSTWANDSYIRRAETQSRGMQALCLLWRSCAAHLPVGLHHAPTWLWCALSGVTAEVFATRQKQQKPVFGNLRTTGYRETDHINLHFIVYSVVFYCFTSKCPHHIFSVFLSFFPLFSHFFPLFFPFSFFFSCLLLSSFFPLFLFLFSFFFSFFFFPPFSFLSLFFFPFFLTLYFPLVYITSLEIV